MNFATNHKISEEDVKKLNKILEGSGWTVGKICYEYAMLESDAKLASRYAYYSNPEEVKENYKRADELKKKLEAILLDFQANLYFEKLG